MNTDFNFVTIEDTKYDTEIDAEHDAAIAHMLEIGLYQIETHNAEGILSGLFVFVPDSLLPQVRPEYDDELEYHYDTFVEK